MQHERYCREENWEIEGESMQERLCGKEIRYGKSGRSLVLYCMVNEGRVAKKEQMPERAALSLTFPAAVMPSGPGLFSEPAGKST